ncbi:MAG: amidohydrolase family protein [Phycisphaerales bacterium]|nr:MAG: amidohydrolase family protein [Phycisphaerales bacterium]
MKHICLGISIVVLCCILDSGAAEEQKDGKKYAVRAGKILTMARAEEPEAGRRVVNHGLILISDGKIEALGPATEIQVPDSYALIDAADRWAMPGIVEAHTHIGTEGGFNDMVVPLNPELRMADCVNPEDIAVEKAVTGGVTTVNTMQGSGTNLGGFTVIIKMDPSRPEKMILREFGAMKMTQAFNPERRGGDLGLTRMGMSWMIRYVLREGKEYTEAWQAYEDGQREDKPEYKPELEKMRKAFEGKIPTIVHTYTGWGVMQTIRTFYDENNLKVIPTHTAGGGYLVGNEAAKRDDVHINIGPRVLDFSWTEEYDNRFHGMGSEYYARGVTNLSINTDSVGWSHFIAPQEELAAQAAMSARLGLDDQAAIEAITIRAAQALGIDDRVGSLEVGKDADIVIKQGSLLDVATPVDLVLVNGRVVYQRRSLNLVAEPEKPTTEEE